MHLDTEKAAMLGFASEIVAAYAGANQMPQNDLPNLIKSVFDALAVAAEPEAVAATPVEQKPAVPIKKSVTDEYIISLEDGAELKMMKRYLMTHFKMTPADYRAKWKLPSDYPMVAPSYARMRSQMAKRIGLGQKAPARGRGRRKAV